MAIKGKQDGKGALAVNEHEGLVLGLIERRQPVTRYEVLKAFQRAPITTYNTSKGSVYPLIRRMVDRGLVAVSAESNARGAESLSLTDRGARALRHWLSSLRLEHALLHDPIRSRALSLAGLDRDAKLEWIITAKTLLLEKKAQLSAYDRQVVEPFLDGLEDDRRAETGLLFELNRWASDSVIDINLQFLDRLLIALIGGSANAFTYGASSTKA